MEKRSNIAVAMQHAGYFDAPGASAIKDHVVADCEAPDRWIQIRSLAACLGYGSQKLALLMDFVDETISGFGVVLRDEPPNICQIGLGEFRKYNLAHRGPLLCCAAAACWRPWRLMRSTAL
jgi:hypothetical protein